MFTASRSEATRTHSWSLSNPMYRLPTLFAATSVDPLPQNGSSTTWSLAVVNSINTRNSFVGFWGYMETAFAWSEPQSKHIIRFLLIGYEGIFVVSSDVS